MIEFKKEVFVEREKEIGIYLLQGCSQKQIAQKTNLTKKIIAAHMHNMMNKLKAKNTGKMIKLLRNMNSLY